MSGGGSSSTTEQAAEGGGASTKPGRRYLDPLMTKCKPIVACAGKQTSYSSTYYYRPIESENYLLLMITIDTTS